ncbi:UDP-glucoronosyl and UDP-glucosyl transferase domain-containing protein [Ditylenchus destructor]|uniref:UDP-glucuronosyltransferase n=1 Tax=Ditylenchus destructor TaxID=166010 RepID=A0AAD4R302_9BILA|nr:UDP-glucoronosyl and UDP-glucosyl transferase domain-containing protein [Ditylenchus destructor]
MRGFIFISNWILFFTNFGTGHGAKILFTAAVDSGTHIGSMVPLIKRTMQAGHNVTVFDTSALKKARDLGPNVTMIFIQVPQDKSLSRHMASMMFREVYRADTLHTPFFYGNDKLGEFMANKDEFQKIRLIMEEKWDLVILDELFGIHSYAFATFFKRMYGTPYIVYSTTAMIQNTAYILSLGRNLAAEPYLLTSPPIRSDDIYSSSDFLDRFNNVRETITDILSIGFYVQKFGTTNMRQLGVETFNWNEFFKGCSCIFADYLDRWKVALTESSDIRGIGSTCAVPKRLPSDLENFVSDSKSKGTIYIAFGTNVDWSTAPETTLDAFFGAIDRFEDYRVIFSYNGIPRPVKPHVKLIPWAPQFDVLAHSKTKLFISHGGLKSFKETICAKMPVIYMPVFAEQAYNSKLALRMGYAGVVNKFTVTKETLSAEMEKVLSNSTYKSSAIKAYEFYLDRPIESLDDAMFTIERVLKNPHKRAYFPRKGMDLNCLQHFHLDLISVILSLLFILTNK